MYQATQQHAAVIPLAAALEIAARRTVAQYTAQARPRMIAELNRAESALASARQIAKAIA